MVHKSKLTSTTGTMQEPTSNDNPEALLEIRGSRCSINSIVFAMDSDTILAGGGEGILRRWRVDDGHEVDEPIQLEGAEIYAIALSPDEKWLVCGLRYPSGTELYARKPRLRVWDARTLRDVPVAIDGHTQVVYSVDISPNSRRFASGSEDKLVFIWSITTGKIEIGPLQHDGTVAAVRFSPGGDRIATGTASGASPSIRIYDSNNGQQLLHFPFRFFLSWAPPFVWSTDGSQLFAASEGEAKRFEASSGTLISRWQIPDKLVTSIALSHNGKFVVICTDDSLSFWDASSQKQIGIILQHTSRVWSFALSPNNNRIATGQEEGTVTLWSLRDILPSFYFTVNLPLMEIRDVVLKSWSASDLVRVEELLTEEIESPLNELHNAQALAHRALIRTRLKKLNEAIDDAKKSIERRRTAAGHIANALTRIGTGGLESATRLVDLTFTACTPAESEFLLLIKAIVLFECGKHDGSICRVEDLIGMVDGKESELYTTIRARMLLTSGSASIRRGETKHAIELFKQARAAFPFPRNSHLVTISLIFGWHFDRLPLAVHLLKSCEIITAVNDTEVQDLLSTMVNTLGVDVLTSEVATTLNQGLIEDCLVAMRKSSDVALGSKDPREAIVLLSTALSLNPSDSTSLFIKRSKAKAMLKLWNDALKDADAAIRADPMNPWGYERMHAALHGLRRFDEAIGAFQHMLLLMERSPDEETRQSADAYVSLIQSKEAIDSAIYRVFKTCPLVLIDIKSGRLCDARKRIHTFKSEPQFKELVSSMTMELDDERIRRAVGEYFQYVTLSHVWGKGGQEPLFQDVQSVKSVWKLPTQLPLNNKLRNFCAVVRDTGYRWAWSDTCCIDKTISTVLNLSLKMMYRWYEACAITFVLLADVESPSAPGDLPKSSWMTRAWTGQELLAPKVIRFYDSNWKPYLNITCHNHKESPEILQEIADAVGISGKTIASFNPDDLSIREKLRLASSRNATVEEDVAYSLIGIFKSDIRPDYGDGYAALGHLLAEIVSRSGSVTALDWTGKSSPYNSCLPATLAVYREKPGALLAVGDGTLDHCVEALKSLLSREEAILAHDKVIQLPRARFAHRRLHLPCIILTINRLDLRPSVENRREVHYQAQVSGIKDIEFKTLERLSRWEPHRFVFAHPWIADLCEPHGRVDPLASVSDDGYDSEYYEHCPSPPRPSSVEPIPPIDSYIRALRLVSRLQQPFHALLLQRQQPHGEFVRVATEYDIIIPGLALRHFKSIHTKVVEIL